MKKEINFKYCIVKPFQKQWGVFTIEPKNQKGYIWFITREDNFDRNTNFCLIPMWTNRFRNKKKCLSKKKCIELAKSYNEFCENSYSEC